MVSLPRVPGVYYEPRPRTPAPPHLRTDVAGFVGLEPRVVNCTTPSHLTESTGHLFAVEVAGFNLDTDGVRGRVPQVVNLVLSEDSTSIPIDDGESIVYSLLAVRNASGSLRLAALPGDPAPAGREHPLADRMMAGQAGGVSDVAATLVDGAFQLQVDITHAFYTEIGASVFRLADSRDFILADACPLVDGKGMVYTLLAVETVSGPRFQVIAGAPADAGTESPPGDAEVRAAFRKTFGIGGWVRVADLHLKREDSAVSLQAYTPPRARIADVHIRRRAASLYLTVVPTLPPARLEDWSDYVRAYGPPRRDGTLLAPAVRAFFANGGRRCHVATVRRPDFADQEGLKLALGALVGSRGTGEREATGLERLLLIPEVSFVDVPDLYARRGAQPSPAFELPPLGDNTCFTDCDDLLTAGSASTAGRVEDLEPLFTDDQVQAAQTALLRRCCDERWRVFLLLSVPMEYDAAEGRYRAPGKDKAADWRQLFARLGEEPQRMSCAGLYYPWVLSQERVDAPVLEMPPTPFVAGVMARRDLLRGPHVAPANETLHGVVGVTRPIDDSLNGELYEPPSNINILRPFPGYGVQLWGARTLSDDRWLRYVPVRRGLSAIERRAAAALQPLVFEPNTPMLWLQITQILLDILLPVFESGALRGNRPEDAFYIRCDGSVNPPEQIEQGVLVCEVGVAIAAPAEFILFRLGRREGVVEVME